MAALVLPSRRVVQPQGPVEIDRANEFGARVSVAVFPGSDGLARGANGVISTGPAGREFALSTINTATPAYSLTNPVNVRTAGSAEKTYLVVFRRFLGPTSAPSIFIEETSGGFFRNAFFFNGSSWVWRTRDTATGDAGSARDLTVAAPVAGAVEVRAFVLGQTFKRTYRNGRLDTSTATAAPFTSTESTLFQFACSATGGASYSGDSRIALFAAIDGALSDAAVARLSANPWQLFRPLDRSIYFLPSDVGGGVSTVSASLSGAWSCRNLAGASLAGASSVRTSAASALSGSWSVRGLALSSVAGAWSVRNQSAASLPGAWSVRNTAASALPGSWSVLAAGSASSTLAGAWSVRNAASRSLAGSWSVRSLAGATFSGAWSVQSAGSASALLAGGWSVRNLSAASVGGSWSVRASAAAALPGGWQVRNSVAGPSLIGSWSVTALASSTLAGSWSVDGSAPSIDWTAPGARAVVPRADVLALVPGAEVTATVPAANVRAVVPLAGDDMDIIKTFDHQAGDTEIYELAYGPKYLDPLADTPATLSAFTGGHAGIAPEVSVGSPAGAVVKFSVDGTVPVGSYTVSAQLATAAGRKKTAAVQVNVES